ncbi:hypothetical protein, partial [Pseudomonas aeruginosa]|uniref:hypothetical protein n=1 Tax=Pseudomonas aeruginosa TaxID=287 RepID=UPI003CEFEEE6
RRISMQEPSEANYGPGGALSIHISWMHPDESRIVLLKVVGRKDRIYFSLYFRCALNDCVYVGWLRS